MPLGLTRVGNDRDRLCRKIKYAAFCPTVPASPFQYTIWRSRHGAAKVETRLALRAELDTFTTLPTGQAGSKS